MSALIVLMGRLRAIGLLLTIYAEAIRLAPWLFLKASMWWLLRKRLRARGQFAPLLGRTSHAYEWWCLRQQDASSHSSPGDTPPLVALVGSAPQNAALDRTLRSLCAEGVEAHVIGPDARPDLIRAAELIDWARSPWLMPLEAGDVLAPGAAGAYRDAIKASSYNVIYADDDVLDPYGLRRHPHFKSDWNAELYRHHDYLTGACIVNADSARLKAVAETESDWAATLAAAAVASGCGATHIRAVLHHRQSRPRPRFSPPPLQIEPELPRLSAIIPTRNQVGLLATCLAGLEDADYPDIEVIVVDNDSDDPATLAFLAALPARSRAGRLFRVLRHPGPFNYSAINNRAVVDASGALICLLNNDIEMLAPDWLAVMATQSLRDDVGAVGAQLLYPDGRIQHAGVVIGVGNAAGHAHRLLRPEDEGYFRRHALPQFVSAVTAACLVVRRERYLAVGGLDVSAFPVAFNDVDLCLRLNARGWQSFYEPRAVLVHHESVSRGFDRDPVGAARFAGELAALQNRWSTMEVFDPYHHPRLSRASEQFALAL